jgi:hypothetical protein
VPSLTNISLPEELIPAARDAAQYYKYETLGQFFRLCAKTLIEHHQRRDVLASPFQFVAIPNGKEAD